MFEALARAYTRLDDDPELRVGLLHAHGAHFTAGLDLPAMAPLMRRGEKAVPLGLVDPLDLGLPGYRRRGKPMVVAVKIPGMDKATAQGIVDKAHQACPYSNATRGNIEVTITLAA